MTERREGRIIHKEETEAGDVAKSLMNLINSQFTSNRFDDVLTSTRLSRFEIQAIAVGNVNRVVAKIYSISKSDTEDTSLSQEEQNELKELWALKRRLMKNPMALSYIMWDGWMKTYVAGLQSLDGMSRQEGVDIASGATKRMMEGNELSLAQKLRKLASGNVMYNE